MSDNEKFITLDNLGIFKDNVEEKIATKQDTLISGTNIKTINGNSLLGSGGIVVQDVMQSLTDEEIEEAWDDVVYSELDDNSWGSLKAFSLRVKDKSEIPATWLGKTKKFTYRDRSYKARLVDTTGKHIRISDGSKAWLLFEITEVRRRDYAFNSANSNNVADSPLLKSFNNTDGTGEEWFELPADLRAVLEDVNVLVAPNGTATTTTNLPFKVFFGREADLFSSRSYSVAAEFDAITQDEYYQSHDYDSARKKYDVDTFDSRWYLLMSPSSGSSSYVCDVGAGTTSRIGATIGSRVAFRFAI